MSEGKVRPWRRLERNTRLIQLALSPCTVRVEVLGNALPATISTLKIEDLEIEAVENDEVEFRGRFIGEQMPSRVAVLAEVIESIPTQNKENVYIYPLGSEVLAPNGEFVFTVRSLGNTLEHLMNGQGSNFRVRIGVFGIDIWNHYQFIGNRLIKLNARLVDITTSHNYLIALEKLKNPEDNVPPQPKLGSFIYFL